MATKKTTTKGQTKSNTKKRTEKKPTVGARQKKIADNKVKLIDAMTSCLGIVSDACEAADLGRSTYYQYIKDDPTFAEACEDIENVTLDFVESKLLNKIKNNDTTAIIFYLKTKGKKRGYIEKVELEVSDKTVSDTTQFQLHKVG